MELGRQKETYRFCLTSKGGGGIPWRLAIWFSEGGWVPEPWKSIDLTLSAWLINLLPSEWLAIDSHARLDCVLLAKAYWDPWHLKFPHEVWAMLFLWDPNLWICGCSLACDPHIWWNLSAASSQPRTNYFAVPSGSKKASAIMCGHFFVI